MEPSNTKSSSRAQGQIIGKGEDFTDVESAQAEFHNTRQELLFAPGSARVASHAVVFRGVVLPSGGGLWGGGKYHSPKNDCMGGYCKGGTPNKP